LGPAGVLVAFWRLHDFNLIENLTKINCFVFQNEVELGQKFLEQTIWSHKANKTFIVLVFMTLQRKNIVFADQDDAHVKLPVTYNLHTVPNNYR
jgi:uncharacterized protein (DUF2132 family)